PNRFAFSLRVQIPNCIDHRSGGEMNDAFLGTEPTELCVSRDRVPERGQISGNRFQGFSSDPRTQGFDCRADDIVATAVGEGEPVTFKTRIIGTQNYISSRII